MTSTLFKINSLLKGIGYLVLYIILPSLISIPFLFIKKYLPNHSIITTILNIIPLLLTTIIFILLSKETLKNNIKSFTKKELITGLLHWLIGLSIMIISSIIISYFDIPLPLNEQLNREQLNNQLVYQITSSVLLVPIIEEIIFRLSTKDLSSNKHIYAITTGLLFAILHLPDALLNPILLFHLFPISAIGIAFGYAYKKTNNILTTIIPHSLHNLISILKLIILGG